jgi:SAM-dependent methyltransferase
MNRVNYLAPNWLALKINNSSFQRIAGNIEGQVVDLGCGSAQYKHDILLLADEYLGVDWEQSAHDRSEVGLFADLSEPLPIEDEFADTITAFQVMEHLPEPGQFLAECWRITRSGGSLLLTVPFMWWIHEEPHDFYRYTRYGLSHLLEKHGYREVEIFETTGYWQMMVLKANYYSERFARGPLRILFIPFWFLGQAVAPLLDRLSPSPQETASYVVVAKKP